jgi:hypothetical protein
VLEWLRLLITVQRPSTTDMSSRLNINLKYHCFQTPTHGRRIRGSVIVIVIDERYIEMCDIEMSAHCYNLCCFRVLPMVLL